jgi:hypothetical protein
VVAALWLSFAPAYAQSPDLLAQHVVGNYKVNRAREALDNDYEAVRSDAIRFAEGFTEEQLRAACADAFARSGLSDVKIDHAGNVLALRKGSRVGPTVVVAVRLPAGGGEQGERVRIQGARLSGPGVADSYTVALLLGSVRALNSARVEILGDILFVVNSGRDTSQRWKSLQTVLESPAYKGRISAFIEFQPSAVNDIITASPATRRYRVHLAGATAANALAREIEKIPQARAFTAIQSEPEPAFDFELQSDSAADLNQADAAVRNLVEQAAQTSHGLRTNLEILQDFPAAGTHVSRNIVQLATAVIKELRLEPDYRSKLSDAGAAMSLGIPAIGIGSVVAGGKPYSHEEWIDVERVSMGQSATVVLAVALSVTGVR